MAIVPHQKHTIVNNSIGYISQKLRETSEAIREEQDLDSKLDSTYVAGRDAEAKSKIDDVIKMLRWLYETELGLTAPAPFSDAEVDAINPNFREFDDGT